MVRLVFALISCCFLASATRAADTPPAGTWKLSFPAQTGRITFLIMLSESDKGWVGDVLGVTPQLRVEPTVEKVVVKEDNVDFDVKLGPTVFSYDGKVTKDGKKIQGTLAVGTNTIFLTLLPSKLKNLNDKFAVAKETLEQSDGQEYFDAALSVLGQATAKKMKADDVRALVDTAVKTAESYGARWQRAITLKVASALADQEAFATIAVEQARQAERMLKPEDDVNTQMQVLEALAATLKKAKKLDELKPIEARITKLEAREYAEYVKKNPPFKVEEFKGRKGKSDRVVLLEQFVDADDPACVAAELASDAIQMTYKPTEVVLMQYHLPSEGADPLFNKDDAERAQSYRIMALPLLVFSGKKDDTGRGNAAATKAKYLTFCETIDELLEKPAGAKLKVSAVQKGNEISIKANVSELANPGEKVFIRFALTEERVRFVGANGLRYHHNVVRNMPGGAKGIALLKKDSEQTATVDLAKLREDLAKFGAGDDIPKGDGPDALVVLRNLRVVAFIQDDAAGEVLQAAQVEIEEKKGE